MNKKEIFNKLNINIISLEQKGKATIITTKDKKYIYKNQTRKSDFYDYLLSRNFNNFPKVYTNIDDEIELTDFIDETEVPIEQKIEDLTFLLSILHGKTIFDKQVNIDFIKKIYEETIEKQETLLNYYQELQDIIEQEVYMSPADYYLIRNVSIIYKSIVKSRKYLDNWYSEVQKDKIIRYAYTHGNLKKEHILENDNLYLISWDNSMVNILIYDLENLYNNNYMYFSIKDLLKVYENKLPLKKDEKDLLFSMLLMPIKINYNQDEYSKIKITTEMILRLEKVLNNLESDSEKSNNNTNK